MSRLSLRFLGPFAVTLDDEPVTLEMVYNALLLNWGMNYAIEASQSQESNN